MIKSIEKFIEEFHGWNFPIDPNLICKKMKINVDCTILPNYVKGYYNKEKRTIFINNTLSHHASRFIIAREIRQASYPFLKSNIEKNYFAQELLIPTREFVKKWEESFPTQVLSCSWYFDVSSQSIIIKAQKVYEKRLISNFTYKYFTDIFNDW